MVDGVRTMRVFVACEFSGIVRDAFIDAGHDAVSIDVLPSESDRGPHIQRDVNFVDLSWADLLIAHPPCTFLTNAANRWLYDKERQPVPERWYQMRRAAEFFKSFLDAPVEKIAVENPIMVGHAVDLIGRNADQTVQPWQHGHGETKAIRLWLKNLPTLEPTEIVDGREPRVHHASPGPDRWKERSRFYTGIARAMAEQWG